MSERKCYTVKDLQEMLGVSRQSIYGLLKQKEFRWIYVGGKYRIPKRGFDDWLENGSYGVWGMIEKQIERLIHNIICILERQNWYEKIK